MQPKSLWRLTAYFLKLGTIGFGGPVALVGYMYRDLVEQRGWVGEEEYRLGLALSQILPGPLAAQLAIALGYLEYGVMGATLTAVVFVLPSFLMVIGISMLYVAYGGLWWMQALFYGIGATVIAIIFLAAVKLARSTNKGDVLLWFIFGILLAVTIVAQAELAQFFILAGLTVLLLRAPPAWLKKRLPWAALAAWPQGATVVQSILIAAGPTTVLLLQILLFFLKSGFFVFGSGLAIVPFLYQGVVQQFGWLDERQFLDAVAVAMITPGPVVITVAFIGYLVAGLAGASVAAVGIFLPVYLPVVTLVPWFNRHRDNEQLRAFVQGATAAATGAIAGAVVVLARRAIYDLPTALIALVSLVILWRSNIPEPIIVILSGLVGLAVRPMLPLTP